MITFLRIQRDGPVLTLTMNEPHTRDALTGNAAVAHAHLTAEHHKAVKAFLEKRPRKFGD